MGKVGARVESPVTLLHEYVTALGALLRGEAVLQWAAARADTVVLQPTADDPDPEDFVRFVANEVRPLVP